MKQPGIVQKIVALPVLHTEHLVWHDGSGVFVWTSSEEKQPFVFPDWMAPKDCTAGAQCTQHAECVARVLGGHPLRVTVPVNPEPEELHPPAPPAPRSIADRIHANRAARKKWGRTPTPEEVYAELEQRHLE